MKKGYAIAKNSLKKEFFTSTSAYDRAQWIPVTEATAYTTVEQAENALKKLYRYGQIQARVVPLEEMNLDFEPIEGREDELPPEGGEGDLPLGDELGGEDDALGGEDDTGDDEDSMDAEQTGEVCPKCEHDPCTCEDNPDEDELNPDDFDGEMSGDMGDDLEGSGDDFDAASDELDLELGDGEDELEQEADPRFDGRRLGMASLSPIGAPRMESAETLKIKDPATTGKDDNALAADNDAKVKIPAGVMSDLSSASSKFKKEADLNKTDDARATFCLTVSGAMDELKSELDAGTVEAVKRASLKLNSFMNAITVHVPDSVKKFIATGGQKPSLKDMFNAKREERK